MDPAGVLKVSPTVAVQYDAEQRRQWEHEYGE
jgi:hypothetical protein